MSEADRFSSEVNESGARSPASRRTVASGPIPQVAEKQIDDAITMAVKARGAMYGEGVVASMVDAGMSPQQAREAISRAVKAGNVQMRGDVILPANESYSVEESAGEKLTAAARRSIPTTKFAWPEKRKFPVHDRAHALSAMGRLTHSYNAGYIDAATYERVRRNVIKAYQRFGIKARAPSALAGPGPQPAVLGRAAEAQTTTREINMAAKKTTAAQLHAQRMRNLAKAWAATGAKPRRTREEEAGEGKRGRGKKRGKARGKTHKRGTHRLHEEYGWAAEPKGKGKGGGKDPAAPLKAWYAQQAAKAPAGAPRAPQHLARPAPAAAKPAPRAAAPRAPRAAASPPVAGAAVPAAASKGGKQKRRQGRVPPGKYMSPTTGAIIQIQRVYPRENPTLGVWDMAGAGGGLVGGLILSDVLDRGIATRTPEGKAKPVYGPDAAIAVRTKADALRMGAQLAGAALFGAGAYFSRNYSSVASYTMGGVSAGFLVRFLLQIIGDVAMPALFKASSPAEETFSNRYYSDKQDWTQQGATAQMPPKGQPVAGQPVDTTYTAPPGPQAGWPGMIGAPMLLPPGAFQQSQQPHMQQPAMRQMDYGPVATSMPSGAVEGAGSVGGCGGGGCGSGSYPHAGWFAPGGPLACPSCGGSNTNCGSPDCGLPSAQDPMTPPSGCSTCGGGASRRQPPPDTTGVVPEVPPSTGSGERLPSGEVNLVRGDNIIDINALRASVRPNFRDLIRLSRKDQQKKQDVVR